MIRTFISMLATNAFTGYTQASQAWLIQPVSIFSICMSRGLCQGDGSIDNITPKT
jgi:hypothetical protein